MTADGKINLDMLIRVAADQARREVKEFFAEVRAGTSEAKNLGSASAAATAPLDRLGAGAKSAAEPFNVLAANITRTEAEFSSYIATLGAAAVSVGVDAATAAGPIYMHSNLLTWTFPASFLSAPVVAGGGGNAARWLGINAPSVGSVQYRVFSYASSGTLSLPGLTAIGRWF